MSLRARIRRCSDSAYALTIYVLEVASAKSRFHQRLCGVSLLGATPHHQIRVVAPQGSVHDHAISLRQVIVNVARWRKGKQFRVPCDTVRMLVLTDNLELVVTCRRSRGVCGCDSPQA